MPEFDSPAVPPSKNETVNEVDLVGATSGTVVLTGKVTGDAQVRLSLLAGGSFSIGDGAGNVALNWDNANKVLTVGAAQLFTLQPLSVYFGNGAGSTSVTGDSNCGIGAEALASITTGSANTAIGYQAMHSQTVNHNATAVGWKALYSCDVADNVAVGYHAGYAITTGQPNVAVGTEALFSSTIGENNVAIGPFALYYNTTGSGNTAVGLNALSGTSTTTTSNNTACGFDALQANTTAANGVAVGANALFSNTSGAENTAIGSVAMYSNTTGTQNVAIGYNCLYNSGAGSGGIGNSAVGHGAMFLNTTGNSNVALGYQALINNQTGSNNTALGTLAGQGGGFSSNNNSVFVGYNATTSVNGLTNVIALGYLAVATASNTCVIGNTSLVSIITSAGLLWATDNSVDIGASGANRPRSFYWGTQALGPNGTALNPTYSFAGATSTGLYNNGGSISISIGNAETHRFGATNYDNLSNSAVIRLGASADVILARDGAAGILALKNGVNAQTLRVYGTTTGPQYVLLAHDGTDGYLRTAASSGQLFLGVNNAAKWKLTTAGDLMAVTDATNDIGASGATRPRTVYVATSLVFGNTPATAGTIALPNNSVVLWRNAANSGNIGFVVNGLDDFSLGAGTVAPTTITLNTAGGSRFKADGTGIGFFGNTPVARQTYGAPTGGAADRTTFDTTTVTLPQLAQRVRAIIDDNRSYGLFA